MRKVIQITSAPWGGSVALTALCDDGTMWEMNSGRWTELPTMVQDESKDPLAVAVGKLNDIETVALSMRYNNGSDARSTHVALADYGEQISRILDRKG